MMTPLNEYVRDFAHRIDTAFEDAQYPGDENIHRDWHVQRRFKGRHWQELTHDDIKSVRGSLTILNPKALCFFLPALMKFLLIYPEDGDVLHDAVIEHLLVPDENDTEYRRVTFPHKVQCLDDDPKRAVIVEFLELYKKGEYPWFYAENAYEAQRLDTAIRFWKDKVADEDSPRATP